MNKILAICFILLPYRCFAHWQQTAGPTGGNTIGIAFNQGYIFTGTNQGVFRSSNNGANWINVSTGLTYPNINDLVCVDSVLIAATDSGIYTSANNGNN